MTLEDILAEHFQCKKSFLKKPKVVFKDEYETKYEYMTSHGARSYEQLVSLIYDLGELGIGIDSHHVIECLDSIVSGKEY